MISRHIDFIAVLFLLAGIAMVSTARRTVVMVPVRIHHIYRPQLKSPAFSRVVLFRD